MKIAVASTSLSSTLGRFGQGSDLAIWEFQDGVLVAQESVVQAGGCCGGLARKVRGVDVVLCDGIGHGAMNHLEEQGTRVARPKQSPMEVKQAVELWLSGETSGFFVKSDDCDRPGCGDPSGHEHHHGGHGHHHEGHGHHHEGGHHHGGHGGLEPRE